MVEDNAACPGEALGCTGPGLPIWLDPSWGTWRDQRFFFLHELGHQFDYLVMPDWARAKFEVLNPEPTPALLKYKTENPAEILSVVCFEL